MRGIPQVSKSMLRLKPSMDDLDSQVRSMMSQRGKWGSQQIESSNVPRDAVPSAWADDGGDDRARKPLAPRRPHTTPQQGRGTSSTLLQARAVMRTCSSGDEREGDASP
jgi:hypothetical protein